MKNNVLRRLRALAACAAAALPGGAALATPYTPASGAEVVEVLPRRADPLQRELRSLRAGLAARPRDLALATALARRYIGAARSEADPRYLGYAQAALAPWWRLPAPPAEVRLLRATVLQSTHQFAAALADLDALVAADPANAQAWLTRATVLTVQGDYPAASASCARAAGLADALVGVTCLSGVAGVTGRAAQSERLLELTLRRSAAAPALRCWALTLLAEMATRRGDAAAAEARYRGALALDPRDSYLLGAYADFLLDQRRPAEVLKLLRGQGRVDALLLRQALALQQGAGTPQALAAAAAELGARFDAAALRGDTVHQREQARFELHLRRDGAAALALARRNWALQKEPADTRIYLEAALAARDAAAAAPVLQWIAANGVEDVALARLARQLRTGA
jgi:predicted Zn-dependent protease